MPRSITGTPLVRRPLLGVAMLAVAAAVAAGSLSGCSAGQKTQTDSMVAAVPGANADSADHQITVRDVRLVHRSGGYPKGGTAPLALRIFNNHLDRPVKLTRVTSDVGTVVEFGAPTASPPTTSESSVRASASASAGASASASPTPVGNPAISVQVPAGGYVLLLPETGHYLAITGLVRPLPAGTSVMLTLNFDDGSTIEINVPMSPPQSPGTRSTLPMNKSGEGH